MFYLLKKTAVDEIRVGERVMVLADYCDLPAGQKGEVVDIYTIGEHRGVTIRWIDKSRPAWAPPMEDGFGEDELDTLAFETAMHPYRKGGEDA